MRCAESQLSDEALVSSVEVVATHDQAQEKEAEEFAANSAQKESVVRVAFLRCLFFLFLFVIVVYHKHR